MRLISKAYDSLYHFRPVQAGERFLEALHMAKELNDPHLIAMAFLGKGQAIWYVGRFADAADTVLLALHYFEKDKVYDKVNCLRILSNIYDDLGNYEKAFHYIEEALAYFDQLNDRESHILLMTQMGKLYKNIGDFDAALEYYHKAAGENPSKGEYPYRELNHCLGELYMAQNKYDSGMLFFKRAMIGNPNSRIIRQRLGEYYLMRGNTDSASYYFLPLYDEARRLGDINGELACLIGLGNIAFDQKNNASALRFADQALTLSEKRGVLDLKIKTLQLLIRLHHDNDPAKALYYRESYDRLRDSSVSDLFRAQLYTFKQKAQQAAAIRTVESEKKIAWRTMMIIILIALFVLAIFLLRNNNEKLRLRQQAADSQMQALRAQMNPHFIFNCLSAINHFVLNNDTAKASEYLTRFSRLMRMVLANADKNTLSLQEELDTLRLYLEMEKLRFNNIFSYQVTVDPAIHASEVQVPSFILQPFCENAIWHGLLHKEGSGLLEVEVQLQGNGLLCTIRDNGIGIEKARSLKPGTRKNDSMGQKLAAQRLAVFNGDKNIDKSFSIQELKDNNGGSMGTMVTLYIKQHPAI